MKKVFKALGSLWWWTCLLLMAMGAMVFLGFVLGALWGAFKFGFGVLG